MSTIPFFETRQEYEEVLLLITEIVSQCRFPSELGLQVTDLNKQPFTLLIMLRFELIELTVIAAKGITTLIRGTGRRLRTWNRRVAAVSSSSPFGFQADR